MTTAVATVRPLLEAEADPQRARDMAAYMKQIAPFLGLRAPTRRAVTGNWVRGFEPGPVAGQLLAAAHDLVLEPERDFAYVAIDLVSRHHRALPASALPDLRALALHVPWWDTVDAWASVIGRVGLRHQGWDDVVLGWARDDQLWARRIALVFQVGRKESVDLDGLFAACRANFDDPDFFMRKGIGWGLRDAARTHPEQVRAFVARHGGEMAPLSVREAMKHLRSTDVQPIGRVSPGGE